jgi:hypothetical protein
VEVLETRPGVTWVVDRLAAVLRKADSTQVTLTPGGPAGSSTKLIVTAHFDNSAKNKYNPDPKKDVRWGDPTYDEMMIGWADLLIPNPTKPDAAAKAAAGGK